ncbi:MAG: hypothetical protein WCJ30_08410 [Deltaproteobacteria bacterium]
MYLAAQHVRAKDGREGVNVFAYTHRNDHAVGIDWKSPDVVGIAERNPGRLMFAVRSVESSGNSVRSYLDVAVSDDLPARSVASLLEGASLAWRPELVQATAVWSHGPMSLRLYVAASIRESIAAEFRVLKDELMLAIAHAVTHERGAPSFEVRPSQPIRVVRRRGEASSRYALDESSHEALRRLLPANVTLPASVNVSLDTEDAFRHFAGADLVVEVLAALTHRTVDQVEAVGGIVVVDERSGEQVWPEIHAP